MPLRRYATENKSLNIFNSRLVLATPQTATDADYSAIEGVVAHEYFHNWTGNRVTCRDWFQLSLKEGLTVYRDQEFSSDMNSRGAGAAVSTCPLTKPPHIMGRRRLHSTHTVSKAPLSPPPLYETVRINHHVLRISLS